MTFKITGMNVRKGQPNKGGSRIVAYFDGHNGDIGFKGCALVRLSGGEWRVWPPKLNDMSRAERRAERIEVYFRAGSAMENDLLEAAKAMYALMADEVADDYRPHAGTIERRTFPFTLISIDGKPVGEDEPEADDATGLRAFLGVDPAVAETMDHAGL